MVVVLGGCCVVAGLLASCAWRLADFASAASTLSQQAMAGSRKMARAIVAPLSAFVGDLDEFELAAAGRRVDLDHVALVLADERPRDRRRDRDHAAAQ